VEGQALERRNSQPRSRTWRRRRSSAKRGRFGWERESVWRVAWRGGGSGGRRLCYQPRRWITSDSLNTDVKWRLLFFRRYFDVTRYDVGVWVDVKGWKCRTLKGFFVLVTTSWISLLRPLTNLATISSSLSNWSSSFKSMDFINL